MYKFRVAFHHTESGFACVEAINGEEAESLVKNTLEESGVEDTRFVDFTTTHRDFEASDAKVP